MEFRIFQAMDVGTYKDELVRLMRIVLCDNITQDYPANQAEIYVEKIPGYIEDGSAIVVGAIEKGNLVGFSWAYELSIFGEHRIHIDMIGVEKKFRKNGIARRLVEFQIEEAKRRGINVIEAMTTRENKNSYNWFHSIGFVDERVKVRKDI